MGEHQFEVDVSEASLDTRSQQFSFQDLELDVYYKKNDTKVYTLIHLKKNPNLSRVLVSQSWVGPSRTTNPTFGSTKNVFSFGNGTELGKAQTSSSTGTFFKEPPFGGKGQKNDNCPDIWFTDQGMGSKPQPTDFGSWAVPYPFRPPVPKTTLKGHHQVHLGFGCPRRNPDLGENSTGIFGPNDTPPGFGSASTTNENRLGTEQNQDGFGTGESLLKFGSDVNSKGFKPTQGTSPFGNIPSTTGFGTSGSQTTPIFGKATNFSMSGSQATPIFGNTRNSVGFSGCGGLPLNSDGSSHFGPSTGLGGKTFGRVSNSYSFGFGSGAKPPVSSSFGGFGATLATTLPSPKTAAQPPPPEEVNTFGSDSKPSTEQSIDEALLKLQLEPKATLPAATEPGLDSKRPNFPVETQATGFGGSSKPIFGAPASQHFAANVPRPSLFGTTHFKSNYQPPPAKNPPVFTYAQRTFDYLERKPVPTPNDWILLESTAFYEFDFLNKWYPNQTFNFTLTTVVEPNLKAQVPLIGLEILFDDVATSDVKFYSTARPTSRTSQTSPTQPNKYIYLHQRILKSVSPALGTLLHGMGSDQPDFSVAIAHTQLPNLEFIFKFIYTNQLNLDYLNSIELDSFSELYLQAQTWQLFNLTTQLENLGYFLLYIHQPLSLLQLCQKANLKGMLLQRAKEELKRMKNPLKSNTWWQKESYHRWDKKFLWYALGILLD